MKKALFLISLSLIFITSCKKEEQVTNYIMYKDRKFELSSGIIDFKEITPGSDLKPIGIRLYHDDSFQPENLVQFFLYTQQGKVSGDYIYKYEPENLNYSFLNGGTGIKYDSGGEIINDVLFRDSEQTEGTMELSMNNEIFTIDMSFTINETDTNIYQVHYTGKLTEGIVNYYAF